MSEFVGSDEAPRHSWEASDIDQSTGNWNIKLRLPQWQMPGVVSYLHGSSARPGALTIAVQYLHQLADG